MINAKTLSEEQVAAIRSWAEGGDGLPEIQRRLAEEFSLKATYLETRFLLDDLGIELLPEPEPELEPEDAAAPDEEVSDASGSGGAPEGDEAKVSLDKVLRPGAMVSGKAHFADGKSLSWWIDQMGRLGVDPSSDGFRPSEAQMVSFQKVLGAELRRSGFA